MCTAVGFDAISAPSDLFSWVCWQKMSKKGFLKTFDYSKDFFSGCTNEKSMKPTGRPGETIESFSGYALQ